MSLWKTTASKIATTVISSLLLVILSSAALWLKTNLVLAGDLTGFADMVTRSVRAELKPLKEQLDTLSTQVNANTRDGRVSRAEALEAYIRDLTIEIQQMEDEKENNPGMWRDRDDLLLEEWRDDLNTANREYAALLELLQ